MTLIAQDKRIPVSMLAIPEDGKTYGVKDGQPEEIPEAGGSVESVTGELIDNTDPLNPVVRTLISKGVRTQTGMFSPTVVGTDPTNLFQTVYAWLGAYNSEGRIIKIRLVTQFNATSGSDVSFRLRIGSTAYATMTLTAPSSTSQAVVEYTVTFGLSSEKKIAGSVMEPITGITIATSQNTIDMESNLNIWIEGLFGTSDGSNSFSVSQVTVEVV